MKSHLVYIKVTKKTTNYDCNQCNTSWPLLQSMIDDEKHKDIFLKLRIVDKR